MSGTFFLIVSQWLCVVKASIAMCMYSSIISESGEVEWGKGGEVKKGLVYRVDE